VSAAGTILLVEDDRDIRETMLDALEEAGYPVVVAVDGVDALEQLRARAAAPALILLDLMMPRMNGAELAAELAKVPAWAAIPVVVISADAHGRATADSLGARDYLKKPVRLKELFGAVEQIIGRPPR